MISVLSTLAMFYYIYALSKFEKSIRASGRLFRWRLLFTPVMLMWILTLISSTTLIVTAAERPQVPGQMRLLSDQTAASVEWLMAQVSVRTVWLFLVGFLLMQVCLLLAVRKVVTTAEQNTWFRKFGVSGFVYAALLLVDVTKRHGWP